MKEIKKNKEIEEKNINLYFDHIFKYLSSKKAEYLSQIESFFTDNAKKLKNKLEIFSEQIEQGEALKGLIDNYEKIIMGKKARKRVPKKNNKCQSKK